MSVSLALRPRDRRALALGAVVVLSALCVHFVVRPFLQASTALRDRLREQRDLLARELTLIAAADRLPAQLDAAADALAPVRDRLLPDRDPFAATAQLVSVVGEAARREGVLLEAIETGAPEAAGAGLVAVRIDVRGRGDLEGLLRWLAALERSRRLLRVDRLSVARLGAAPTDSTDVEILTLAATVRAYVLAEVNAGPPPTAVAQVERRE